jgi:hypothetical protein
MHYCGDILVDTALFKKAKTCGMEMTQSTDISRCSVIKKNCCTEKQVYIEGQDELKISFNDFTEDQKVFVALFVYSYMNSLEGPVEKVAINNEYPPPLIVKCIYKLDEVYLI